jgi:hypothetical protein
MKLIFTILTILLSLNAFAQTPLSWQKVELEDKILTKVKSNLGNVLETNKFLVEVEAKVNDPGMPNFDDIVKKGAKVSDVKFDDSKGDYIAFSKVGLEIPVVEDFHKDNQQKLKEMYRYGEAFDLFKNLEEVSINVYLSDMLKPGEVEIAKNVVNNLKFPLGEIKPKIVYTTIKLEEKKLPPMTAEAAKKKADEDKKAAEEITLKDILDFLSRFGNAFGLIFATIILGISAWLLMKKYFQLKKDQLDAAKEEEKVPEVVPEAPVEEIVAELIPQFVLSSQENFERLRTYLKAQPKDAMVMIKNWINSSSESNQLALRAVAQQFTDEELISLFTGLNDQEREIWSSKLDSFLDEENLAQANQFISEEVVRTMIDPGKVSDIELIDLVIGLPLDIACRYVVEKPESGKVLMNLITPQQITKILNRLPEKDANTVLANSLDLDFVGVQDGFKAFKQDLKDFIAVQKQRPFNSKIMQMVGDFNPLKETLLYSFLAKSGLQDEMLKTAKSSIPFDCISRLPKEIIKDLMQSYPIAKKVQFLSVCDEDMKQDYLKAFAEEGSTARQMLNLEFDSLNSDKATVSRLQLQKDMIVKEFVVFTRQYVGAHKEIEQDVEFAVNDWIQTFDSKKPDLKIVA